MSLSFPGNDTDSKQRQFFKKMEKIIDGAETLGTQVKSKGVAKQHIIFSANWILQALYIYNHVG